jgi:hypothetical protein
MEFLPGVPAELVLARLAAADGNEVASGKLESPVSSSALAVNTFGWFAERPDLLPPFPGWADGAAPRAVEVEYRARLPWSGGRHPWLDAAVLSDDTLTGVESKRYEPYRDKKAGTLQPAYDRDVWGPRMAGFTGLRDAFNGGTQTFRHLDVPQLLKHALGLRTAGLKLGLRPRLVYLFAEPAELSGKPIGQSVRDAHRREIAAFATAVAGSEVEFLALSYREWLSTWGTGHPDVAAHGRRVIDRFNP